MYAVPYRIGAERRSNGALFEIFNGCWQSAGAQHQREIVRGFLAEISLDHSGIIDAAIDHWRGINAMFQHDSHLAALILFGEGPKSLRGIARQRKVHFKLARIVGVAIFRSAAQVTSGHHWRPAQHIPAFSRFGRASSGASLRVSGNQFGVRRKNAAMFGQCIGFRAIWHGILDQL